MPDARLALLVDFDDTAAEQNVAEMLLLRFCAGDWRALREQFREGRLTLREYQEAAFGQVEATREEMKAFAASTASLRPGFADLAAFCRDRDIPLAVVTNGLDFYVEGVLEANGLGDVRHISVGTEFGPRGIRFLYPFATPDCSEWGNCKCHILESFRREGRRVVYIGDGRSDLCPASRADLVFARSSLLRHCQEQGIPHRAFGDFTQVVRYLCQTD